MADAWHLVGVGTCLPEKGPFEKERIVFQPSFLRGYYLITYNLIVFREFNIGSSVQVMAIYGYKNHFWLNTVGGCVIFRNQQHTITNQLSVTIGLETHFYTNCLLICQRFVVSTRNVSWNCWFATVPNDFTPKTSETCVQWPTNPQQWGWVYHVCIVKQLSEYTHTHMYIYIYTHI